MIRLRDRRMVSLIRETGLGMRDEGKRRTPSCACHGLPLSTGAFQYKKAGVPFCLRIQTLYSTVLSDCNWFSHTLIEFASF